MNNWFSRLASAGFGLAIAMQALPATAQDEEPNTWTDEPAQPSEPSGPSQAPGPAVAPNQEQAPASAQNNEYADTDPRAISDFKPELDPYGRWVDDPTYGTVWVPNYEVVGNNFAPYVSSGHWALTANNDWEWVSDYPFGWITFHYGRWAWVSGSGWAWIPGRQYSHAWVVWRVPRDNYAYVGWAPAPPSYLWFHGMAVGVGFGMYTPWVFCPSYYAFYPGVYRYVVHDPYRVGIIASHTTRYYAPAAGRWGPPPARARIPATALPAQRIAPDVRAVAAARPSTVHRALPGAAAMHAGFSAAPRPMSATRLSSTRVLGSSPAYRAAPSSNYSYSRGPGYSASPSFAPGQRYAAPARNYPSAPMHYSASPSFGPSRSYSPGPTHYSAPPPSFSAPPGRSFSPGPMHYSPAPSHSFGGGFGGGGMHYSAPSHSFGGGFGGGGHFGGGHFGGGGHHR